MPRRLLVVTTVPNVDRDLLRRAVHEHTGDADAEIHVVAAASDLSPLDWLATAEDDARHEAERAAREASEAVVGEGRAHAEVGDPDPVQAIEDALRTFPADELIVVTHPEDSARWLEKESAEAARERFGLPLTHLEVDR